MTWCPTRGCGGSPPRSMRCAPPATAASATPPASPRSPKPRRRRAPTRSALSPMHALFTADPARFAPYSPSSRLFLNPLHAAPALVFGRRPCGRGRCRMPASAEAFARFEPQQLIDWPASADAKLAPAARPVRSPSSAAPTPRARLARDFARFRAEGGDLLHQHATFEALHADRAPEHDWRRWTLDLRNPGSAAVAAFAAAHRHEVLFHEFLQWVADRSLAAAQARAREAGMRIGLVGDLAVGMDPTGSHAWSRQRDILLGVAIGAPPDLFNPRGQYWGLTGFSPRALEDGGFVPFIATLRAALRHTGGLRIDHAMGLSRLWLVPEGRGPGRGRLPGLSADRPAASAGAGIRPAQRHRGGRGPRHRSGRLPRDAEPRTACTACGCCGSNGRTTTASARRTPGMPTALAMTTTHDLPTVAGWWHGTDIAARAECGRLGAGRHRGGRVGRARRAIATALWQRFVAEGVAEGAPPPPDAPQTVVDAALAFVARTPLTAVPAAGRGFARAGRATEPARNGGRAPELAAPAAGGRRHCCRRRRRPPGASPR